MAFGTFQPHSHEESTDKRGDFFGFATIAEQCHGAVAEGAAAGCNQFANELVPRFAIMKRLPNPVIVIEDRFDADAVGVGAKQIDPFVGPVIGEFGLQEQVIDESGAFFQGGCGIVEKGCGFGGGRNAPDDICEGAAEERVVVAEL